MMFKLCLLGLAFVGCLATTNEDQQPVVETPCLADQKAAELLGFVIQCEVDGSFSKKQCIASMGTCWCVDELGRVVTGTNKGPGEGEVNCDSSVNSDVVTVSEVTQAPVTQAPVTQAPVTQAPVTQAPVTPNLPHSGALMMAEQPFARNHLVTTLSKLSKSFLLKFDLKLDKFESGWRNVIHLTTGGNMNDYGSRAPAIYINGYTVYISSAISGNKNTYRSKTLNLSWLNRWITIEISQNLENSGQYVFTCNVDNELMFKLTNTDPREFSNVQVYVSDPWYATVKGSIRELVITQYND